MRITWRTPVSLTVSSLAVLALNLSPFNDARTTTKHNIDISPESFETHIADQVFEKLQGIELSHQEQRFLSGLIRQTKPRKILELGVSAGGSSALILNAIRDTPEAHLYSIDFSKTYYRDPSKKCGFLVKERFPSFLDQWTLNTGKLAAEYMDELGGEFDFVFIDTAHVLPGEILDFLMVLPYMKEKAFVVLHDISLATITSQAYAYATTLLYCSVNAPKWLPVNCEQDFPNIGAFRIDNGKDFPYIDDLFRILTIPWRYVPDSKDMDVCVALFSQHYRKDQVELFQKIYAWQRDRNYTIRKLPFIWKIYREITRPFRQIDRFVTSFRQK
jgi:predicted O-methyltransferase YrrM